ncbi:MAG TPA: MarR family transcriptional regulator [Sphingomicrobium sp.]|nr:MarR family transcriptional regulator [Sphingomicrobium sp.]
MYQYTDRESDQSTRILELNGQDLESAARLLSLILNAPPARPAPPPHVSRPIPSQPITRDQVIEFAGWLFNARKARSRFFHPGLFGEAAWDVLLVLYTSHQSGPRYSIGALATAADVPIATILRWLQTLEEQGLVRRTPHPNDRRSGLIHITPTGQELMEAYLSEALSSSP